MAVVPFCCLLYIISRDFASRSARRIRFAVAILLCAAAASARPVIATIPQQTTWGEKIDLGTPNAADIGRVVLMRPGAVTHSFNMDQRLVELAFTPAAGSLKVTMPPNANLAPPGWYLVFILDKSGVPSVGRFVHLMPPMVSPVVVTLVVVPENANPPASRGLG